MKEMQRMATSGDDPIRGRLRQALRALYGDRLARAVLFGSRARGDAREESDYDIAVFLKDMPDRWQEMDRLAALRTEFMDQTGVFIDAKPFVSARLADRTPLMHEIRTDGVAL